MRVPLALRLAVRRRARARCEYCRLPATDGARVPFQIEHIISRQHGGPTIFSNLALACHRCNLFKGPNLSSIDPLTKEVVNLFNPRRMKWKRHFQLQGPIIVGRTATGRATVVLLEMNDGDRVELREELKREGRLR